MDDTRLLFADDTAPWGIEFIEGENGNYWANQWRVARDAGDGPTIAVFEFEEHAEAFMDAFGPRFLVGEVRRG